jgi:dTDP-4-amino-4,6-dideoxygalactose transaminase
VRIWKNYHALLEQAEGNGVLQRLSVPEYCNTNGCLYSLILPDPETRERVIQELKSLNIFTVFHFMPLHLSPAGTKYGRFSGTLSVTEDRAGRLLRLPLWVGLSVEHQERVVSCLLRSIAGLS